MLRFNLKENTLNKFNNMLSILALVTVLVLGIGVQPSMGGILSEPGFTLKLDDGTTIITIADNSVYDSLPMLGGILYNGPIGIFNLNVTTAITYPIIGSSSLPELYLSSVDVSSSGSGGYLSITLSKTGFGPANTSDFVSLIGGTLSGTLDLNNYLDNTNTLFGEQNHIAELGTYYPGSFSGNAQAHITTAESFSLTTEVTLTHGSGNVVSSFSSHVKPDPSPPVLVPEPVSSFLFIAGSALMAGRHLRKSRKKNG